MIDFKLNELGDIEIAEQKKVSPLKLNFMCSELPRLRIAFKTKSRWRPQDFGNKLKINFETVESATNNKKISVVTDNEEKAQSIAIRLKTELGELQDFFNDFGSELSRLKHSDLLSSVNHNKIIAYVQNAVADIIPYDDIMVSIDRIKSENSNFRLETLKINIQDYSGNIIYSYEF